MYFEISRNENSPIICNIPHSSTNIPEDFMFDFSISREQAETEAMYMADNFTHNLYGELVHISSYIKSNISRIILDIERFKDPEHEPMSKVGMSALYTHTSGGTILREISEQNRKKLTHIYDDYHTHLTELVSKSLEKNNTAIIIDCHSFPSEPRIYEDDKEEKRPEICIGADQHHTPPELLTLLQTNFEEVGFIVKINSPFSGSIVPIKYYNRDPRVVSVMIEVNRKIYMNEHSFQKLKTFSTTSNKISRCVIKSINQYLR